MDGEEQVLVGGRADDVRRQQEGRRQHGRVAQQVGAQQLQGDHRQHQVLGQRLDAAELENLRGERQRRGQGGG